MTDRKHTRIFETFFVAALVGERIALRAWEFEQRLPKMTQVVTDRKHTSFLSRPLKAQQLVGGFLAHSACLLEGRLDPQGVSADRVHGVFQACYEARRRPLRPSRTHRKALEGTLQSGRFDFRAWVLLEQWVRNRRFFRDFAAQARWKVGQLASLLANFGISGRMHTDPSELNTFANQRRLLATAALARAHSAIHFRAKRAPRSPAQPA